MVVGVRTFRPGLLYRKLPWQSRKLVKGPFQHHELLFPESHSLGEVEFSIEQESQFESSAFTFSGPCMMAHVLMKGGVRGGYCAHDCGQFETTLEVR